MADGKIVWKEVHLVKGKPQGSTTPAVKVTHGGRAMYSYTACRIVSDCVAPSP